MEKRIARYADVAMWDAPPDPTADGSPIQPRVTLLSMTHDPLRVMAAAAELYRGNVVRNVSDVTRNTVEFWLNEIANNKLKAPLEFIQLHFLFEGVTRAFTHQLVRQRTAVYVQESLRFAVKTNAPWEVALPPSLEGLKDDDPRVVAWNEAIEHATNRYLALIDGGVPAEDARGLLPTNITTRVHYHTNLRNLVEHAGLRLCSQAQYEWKKVWDLMLRAIANYDDEEADSRWQHFVIAGMFKPVCYQTGKCEFMGVNDRYCPIRERVEMHHRAGEPPAEWVDIDPREPLREGAARVAPGERR